MQRGDWLAAIGEAEAWLRQGGRDWRVSLNLAVCRSRAHQGGEDTWLADAEEALRQSGHHPMARLGTSEILGGLGRWEQVLELLSDLEPAEPWLSLQMRCEALGRLGRQAEARELLERWPAAGRDWRWRLALADMQVQATEWAAAEALYRAVLSERPHQGEAHHNLALTLLSQQRCAEAWPHYEWRRSNPRLDARGIPTPIPDLDALAGRHVVLRAEQGVGDQIMASRYFRAMAAACGSLTVVPEARLADLLRRQLPAHIAVGAPGSEPAGAEPIGMASLPLLFWGRLGLAADGGRGNLQADPRRVAEWQSRLAALPRGLRLGLGWLGGITGAERRERALSPPDLERLAQWQGVQWLDLQFLPEEQRHRPETVHRAEAVHRAGFHRLGDPGVDLEDSLALIECLDGVVTTRQTVAHLAGALGKPGQVLVPMRPEWRYWGADNSWAWYPSLQLIRQERRGDWQRPLQQAARQWLAD